MSEIYEQDEHDEQEMDDMQWGAIFNAIDATGISPESFKGLIAMAAHTGVDTGYGVYKLEEEHIKLARVIYERIEGTGK